MKFRTTMKYPYKLNSISFIPAIIAPNTISITAKITSLSCAFPNARNSVAIVNAPVVLRNVVYIGKFTPLNEIMDNNMYVKYARANGNVVRNNFTVGNPVFTFNPPFGTFPLFDIVSSPSCWSTNAIKFSLLNTYKSIVDTISCDKVMTFANGKSYKDNAVLLKQSKATAHAM